MATRRVDLSGASGGSNYREIPCIAVGGAYVALPEIFLSFSLGRLKKSGLVCVEGVWRWLVGMAPHE